MKITGLPLVLLLLGLPSYSAAQTPPTIRIEVRADRSEGPLPPVWNFFGYDEPNYTYAPNGKKLLGELAALSPMPVYVRTHNLLTTGDGSCSLKWGSTERLHRRRSQESRSTAGRSWTAFSTPFTQQESSRWWKLASCRRLCPHIRNPIGTTFRRDRSTRAGRILPRTMEVVGTRLSIRPSPSGTLWRCRGEDLVVGSLE